MIPPSKRSGASAVIQNAICSKPVGSRDTAFPFSPAFCIRSTTESAIPSASNAMLRAERQNRSFWMDDAVADLDLLVFVHESFAHVRIMTVLDRGASNQRGPI